MSIEPHIMDDEAVLEHCTTNKWVWVCTDRRVIKYRKGKGSAEQLHDISLNEISAISLVNTGREDKLAGYGIFAIIGGVLLPLVGGPETYILSIIMFSIGGYLMYRWQNSASGYFELRGSGLLQSEPEKWRINSQGADNTEKVQLFVRKVREQL